MPVRGYSAIGLTKADGAHDIWSLAADERAAAHAYPR
jgi:hypothetical protein